MSGLIGREGAMGVGESGGGGAGAVGTAGTLGGGDCTGGSGAVGATGEVGGARPRTWGAGRVRRVLLALVVAVAVVAPLAAFARPRIPAPAPAVLAPVTAATLDEAYEANRANAAEAARMAAANGDRKRAEADRSMAASTRQFLSFDGRGTGQAVEVFGDLAHADRVAVLVPGSDTTLDTYDRFRAGATALMDEVATRFSGGGQGTRTAHAIRTARATPAARATHAARATRTAVVSWLGYETPRTISTTVLTTGRAEFAAPRLEAFVRELRGLVGQDARISLLCHSYGSVVCARAAERTDSRDSRDSADRQGAGLQGEARVDDIVFVGSPGTGADSAAALHTSARVWAARGSGDWIADVPHADAGLFGTTVGFGTDPVSPAFGARVFAAGDGGHSDYFRPGSVSLDNLARIVLGDTSEVTRA
ncbi:alpha/beta hydrolase [Streptomyces acidicola]|uniref:alpha/beta hydrolase n=1 Tax=Streptomyces acidicola TaxID=2596892 RepID=UPI0034482E8E